WIHVPLGVVLILVICWGLRLAIQQAPFRFPAPVIAMIAFFALLLLLELLSIKFPGSNNEAKQLEAGQSSNGTKPKKRKRFVDPFMLLLAPPCEFLLRNMSVMFTPSFILIPAREVIPGKEIGLLAAWFIVSQILAFVIPVLMNRGIQYSYDLVKGEKKADNKASPSPNGPDGDNQLRRGSSATPFRDLRRGSSATLLGVDYEKGMSFSGGQKLGAIATGLSGVTAHMIAPVTHVDIGSNANRNATAEGQEEEEEDAIERLASWFGDLITPTIYFIVFIVGIPLFFLKDFALPLFLGINLLTFIAAIAIVPPPIRRFLHPILSTSLATVLIIWAFAAMKGIGLMSCLNRFYSVDAKYSVLWDPKGYSGPVPGAGDILFSTLDAGIVALAVPMYRYRKELWQNLTRMLIVLFPCAALSLFFWNYIARLMGMDPIRSLAFSARFMSTPLAIELAGNVGADESITVILVVITGVIAAILKEQFFYKLMRVSRDDYLTVGLTMGSTSGAIGASSLISTPRTMAIASLSFVMFGAILLVCTAIPPIVDIVRQLAG
ncbi:uncharacterized protein FA14DRAFT_114919, partial [Meira miltonrushii]